MLSIMETRAVLPVPPPVMTATIPLTPNRPSSDSLDMVTLDVESQVVLRE